MTPVTSLILPPRTRVSYRASIQTRDTPFRNSCALGLPVSSPSRYYLKGCFQSGFTFHQVLWGGPAAHAAHFLHIFDSISLRKSAFYSEKPPLKQKDCVPPLVSRTEWRNVWF